MNSESEDEIRLVAQLEFYFSEANYRKDRFLQNLQDFQYYVSIADIVDFPQLRNLLEKAGVVSSSDVNIKVQAVVRMLRLHGSIHAPSVELDISLCKIRKRDINTTFEIQKKAAVSSVRDPYATLFVDNLDPRVSEALLYELFVQVAPIRQVRIPLEADDTPRGFGFVELCSSAFVQYAIYVMHRTVLFGRPISVAVSEAEVDDGSVHIFVRNLSDVVDDAMLETHFSAPLDQELVPEPVTGVVGIVSVKIAREFSSSTEPGMSNGRRHRGFGFVVVATPADAAAAIVAFDGSVLAGRRLAVSISERSLGGSAGSDLQLLVQKTLKQAVETKNKRELLRAAEARVLVQAQLNAVQSQAQGYADLARWQSTLAQRANTMRSTVSAPGIFFGNGWSQAGYHSSPPIIQMSGVSTNDAATYTTPSQFIGETVGLAPCSAAGHFNQQLNDHAILASAGGRWQQSPLQPQTCAGLGYTRSLPVSGPGFQVVARPHYHDRNSSSSLTPASGVSGLMLQFPPNDPGFVWHRVYSSR